MTTTPIYDSDADRTPDSCFVAGHLRLLVIGNRGRLLDARRTPVSVVGLDGERGAFTVRVEAFEDEGALWDLWLGEVERFQFEREAATLEAGALGDLERAHDRFDHALAIDCDPAASARSRERLAGERASARMWLGERLEPGAVALAERIRERTGEPSLYALLEAFVAERGLGDLEQRFAATFVSNPRSGELVKGHAIVLAELGLCPYRGRVVRDPDLFTGDSSRAQRAEHLLTRLAFTQELLVSLGAPELTLYRAAAGDGALVARPADSFVSATCSRAVADAHFEGGPSTTTAVLWRAVVPVGRVFMTFLETRGMNARFAEAEALLVGDPTGSAF